MKLFLLEVMVSCALFLAGCSSAPTSDSEVQSARSEVRTMASQTIDKLESLHPGSKKSVESAYGYAVFSNFGMKILVAGGGSGEGVAVSRSPRHETFMKMAEVQAGLGFGVKQFRLVWVFTTKEAFDNFVNKGWEFGGQATAQAQAADQGGGMAGAMSIAPGVFLYQITDDGLALELTAKGTRYYKDSDLN